MLGWKFVQMFRVTCPRWLPGPYMVKFFKNLLLRNQEADDLDTLYSTSGAQVLPNLIKWCQWVYLGHFYDMVKFCFPMLLHGWKLIHLIVMYFYACFNSAYPMHSGEHCRTIDPLVEMNRSIFCVLLCINADIQFCAITRFESENEWIFTHKIWKCFGINFEKTAIKCNVNVLFC